MVKLTTKEDIALLVEEASEMFEETGCVPDVDGTKVRAEKIVPRAKRYILETIDNPKARLPMQRYGIRRGMTRLSRGCHKMAERCCHKLAPTVLKERSSYACPRTNESYASIPAADLVDPTNHPAATEVSLEASTTMSKPVSPKPLRKVAAICAYSQDDPPFEASLSPASPTAAPAPQSATPHRRAA